MEVIQQVDAARTLPLRQQVLRPEKTIQESTFEGDQALGTFHLALIRDSEIVAVAAFMQQEPKSFPSLAPYRLRGMAVAPLYQKQGFGAQLLQKGIEILKEKSCDLLWFNARIGAVNFYKRHGFTTEGERFEIPEVGPHYLMYKKL